MLLAVAMICAAIVFGVIFVDEWIDQDYQD
jgi:hypothetical protein